LEYRRFPPGESTVSTFEYHEHRERAPHLEQGIHQDRFRATMHMVMSYSADSGQGLDTRIVDLGCGDGGFLSRLQQTGFTHITGYDFQPSNAVGWVARGVADRCEAMNFIEEWDDVVAADIYVATEVLEHLEEPHDLVRKIRERDSALVCSSPWMEHEGNIDASHNWAWDMPGYGVMLEGAGFEIIESARTGIFQVVLAVPR
jgi:2-polyprenyl-3-methyl-5-hydroxy-6-metoxy-1,4-benzoquinol methylase